MNSKLPLYITSVVTLLLLIGLSAPMSARAYKKHEATLAGKKIQLIHLFDRDARDASANNEHTVVLLSEGNVPDTVVIEFSKDRKDWERLEMSRAGDTDLFAVSLPAKERGKRWYYRFIASAGGADTKFTLSDTKDFYVTYEGDVPKILLILHIALMMLTAILILHAFHYSLEILINRTNAIKAYWSGFLAMVVFWISAFAIGPPISGYTFGEPFGPWPFGGDITDTKSVALALFWLVPLFLKFGVLSGRESHHRISDRAFATWVFVGLIVSIGIYLIPHSLFIQV